MLVSADNGCSNTKEGVVAWQHTDAPIQLKL